MSELLYNVSELNLVDVRKYCGIEDGQQAWVFLGYDVVVTDKDGKACSILAEEETKYDYLKLVCDGKKRGLYDHNGIKVDDIRVKVLDDSYYGIFGKLPVVSKSNIKSWIDKNNEFHFVHYQPKVNRKVKTINNK